MQRKVQNQNALQMAAGPRQHLTCVTCALPIHFAKLSTTCRCRQLTLLPHLIS